jgi:mono/diheme cytochrome c family protein
MKRLVWFLGYCLMPLAFVAVSALMLNGCTNRQRLTQVEVWDDMKRQPKYLPQGASGIFADGRASRRPVAGTIARGHLKYDDVYHTGMVDAETYTGKNPEKIDGDLLKLGQSRFNTYCSPCHDRTGSGKGIVAIKTPAWQPTNLQDDRIRKMADGEIFSVITNGRRTMPAYKYQVVEHDRWAIVAYLRALHLATSGTVADVPAELRTELR